MPDLEIFREVPQPADEVWQAFTDPAALAAWFWPEGFGTEVSIDLHPGGRYHIASPAQAMAVGGEYVAVQPQRRLVFGWAWDGDDAPATRVTVEFEPGQLRLTHEGFATEADRDNHIQGWTDCLDRLSAMSRLTS